MGKKWWICTVSATCLVSSRVCPTMTVSWTEVTPVVTKRIHLIVRVLRPGELEGLTTTSLFRPN